MSVSRGGGGAASRTPPPLQRSPASVCRARPPCCSSRGTEEARARAVGRAYCRTASAGPSSPRSCCAAPLSLCEALPCPVRAPRELFALLTRT